MKTIATYARVSTAKQEEEQTIQTQINALKEFAAKNNCVIVKEFADDGWSGDILARPALDRLRQEAKEKAWEAVLIYDPDRLARRYSYQELVMDELKEAGIEVIFVTIAAPKNSEDKILHGVRGLFAEYERTKITERFRLGKLRKVKEGHILVSRPLYGYDYVAKQEKEHGYYVINESEARIVKLIFSWVAIEGLTLRKVVIRLKELGIKPRNSKRAVWSTSTLSTLLKHKGYIGEAHWGSSYAVIPTKPLKNEKYKKTKKSSRRIKPEDEWIKVPIPAIISKEVFMQARVRLNANFALCHRNKKNEYLLAGKMWCVCGMRRSGEGPQHGKYLYYRCNDRVNSFPLPATCKEKGINARLVDTLVWNEIANLMKSPDVISEQIETWLNGQKRKSISYTIDTVSIEKEITKLKSHEDRYNKAYATGLFDIDRLTTYISPIRERILSLERQLAQNDNKQLQTNAILLPDKEAITFFTQNAIKVLNNATFELKRKIIINAIDKIVGNKERLQIYGHIPIGNVRQNSDDRNRQDTNGQSKEVIPFHFNIEVPQSVRFDLAKKR